MPFVKLQRAHQASPRQIEDNRGRINVRQDPREENWKKAMVLEQLLNLYKTKTGGRPTTPSYSKKEYQQHFRGIRTPDVDECQWDNN